MKSQYLTAIILTYNESLHIERCIRSVRKLTDRIFVVDSFSNDDTVALAEKEGATVLQNKFVHHAHQLNWALKNCPIETEWIIRLDADEYLTEELTEELDGILPTLPLPFTALEINYRHYFWGRWIRYGTRYPLPLVRVWRNGCGLADNRMMDEKLLLTGGKIYKLKNDFIHEDLNDLTFFTDKHNSYATREAIELLAKKYRHINQSQKPTDHQISEKHFNLRMKERFYSRPSLIWVRSLGYFVYRYIFRLGFLDGKEGLVYHFLQGFWFRFLADMKSLEIEKLAKEKNISIEEAIYQYSGYKVNGNGISDDRVQDSTVKYLPRRSRHALKQIV